MSNGVFSDNVIGRGKRFASHIIHPTWGKRERKKQKQVQRGQREFSSIYFIVYSLGISGIITVLCARHTKMDKVLSLNSCKGRQI